VRRDFSLVLDKSIPWKQIDEALTTLRIPELVDWRVREVFNDSRLGDHEYSLLMGTTFQAPDRTLREEELQSFHSQVVEAIGKVGARLRS
jgi:phenylalanyl-tRNA synthetase beta chain